MDQSEIQIKKKAARITFVISIVVLGVKFFAWHVSGSKAIYSDALESIINIITAIFAWTAIHISSMPADKNHPYGHGKVEYFSAALEGLLILIAGVLIIFESVMGIINGVSLSDINSGLGLIFVATLINSILALYLIRTGKKTKSSTLEASGHHVFADALTSIGVIVGLLIVKWTSFYLIDVLIALFVAFHIIIQGYEIVKKAVTRLMDSADETVLSKISDWFVINRKDAWIAPHRLRAWQSGTNLQVDLHLIMPFYQTLKETHKEEHFIEKGLSEALGEPIELIIHNEPCFPEACAFCSVKNCPYRSEEQKHCIIWNIDALIEKSGLPTPKED